MLLVLTQLPTEGLKFEHQYAADELDLSQHEFTLPQPPLVTGRVTNLGLEMRVKGNLSATLIAECDRCLEAVTLPLATDFDLYYLPAEAQSEKSGETELLERDLDFSVYRNERIDLDELVLEQLELSLPTRILCMEACQGLCPQCGTNLNVESCNCQPPMDPRWQALADLKS
ncbi:MAG TPA: DUF177 domain-containing protein [Blastocatellia bacterium]|nr:DUF177 domain-containing protein [Blastocatellia bacterium]